VAHRRVPALDRAEKHLALNAASLALARETVLAVVPGVTRRRPAGQGGRLLVPAVAPAETPAAAAAAPAAAPAADDPEKRMKKISKALKQIDELKKKQADGAKLDADQQAKIAKESALREEMKEVEAILKP
jgi:hypothetical protein